MPCAILHSLASPCARLIVEKKKVSAVVFSLSAEKCSSINVPTGESSAGMLTAQRAFPVPLANPSKLIPHPFSAMTLVRFVAHAL